MQYHPIGIFAANFTVEKMERIDPNTVYVVWHTEAPERFDRTELASVGLS